MHAPTSWKADGNLVTRPFECCVIDCSAVRAVSLLLCHADIDADQLLLRCVCSMAAGHSAYSRGTLDGCQWCTGRLFHLLHVAVLLTRCSMC